MCHVISGRNGFGRLEVIIRRPNVWLGGNRQGRYLDVPGKKRCAFIFDDGFKYGEF